MYNKDVLHTSAPLHMYMNENYAQVTLNGLLTNEKRCT